MCEKFPFKETKSDLCRSMLETGLEGVKGGGRIRIKFTLFSPFPKRLIITDSVVNSDFKTIQHRHKENEFWLLTINVLMIILTEVLKFPNYNFTHYQLKFLTNTHSQNKTFSLLLSINCLVKWLVTVS